MMTVQPEPHIPSGYHSMRASGISPMSTMLEEDTQKLTRIVDSVIEEALTENPFSWLNDLYIYESRSKIDDGLDLLFTEVDQLMSNGEVETCNELLDTIDLGRLGLDLIVGLLSITLAAHDKLPNRRGMAERSRQHLISKRGLNEGDVDKILEGLILR